MSYLSALFALAVGAIVMAAVVREYRLAEILARYDVRRRLVAEAAAREDERRAEHADEANPDEDDDASRRAA